MADMKQKGLTSENSQEKMEIRQPLLVPQSVNLSSNGFEKQQKRLAYWSHQKIEVQQQNGLASESSQEIMEITQQVVATQSADLSSNHLDQQQMKDNVTIDIAEMMHDYEESLSSPTYCLLSPTYCIYRVPPMIRKLKEDAYTPMVVSIGPFHYGEERLQEMEKHKQVLFERFITKAQKKLTKKMVSFVEHSEPKIRASYSENIELSEKHLVKLVLVDAVFIIQLFTHQLDNDAKLSQTYLKATTTKDLVLLENQLPFFVIEELFNIAFAHLYDGHLSFLKLTYCYFSCYNIQGMEYDPNVRIKHFTDLLRLFYLCSKERNEDIEPNHNEWAKHFADLFRRLFCLQKDQLDNIADLLYSAKELEKAGVKFKGSTSNCLLDLKFSEGVIEIPKIFVHDNTELLFRNMIALEQCLYLSDEYYITRYAHMMDRLINTDKDVDVFIHKEIMINWLGDNKDFAKLFNGLCKNIYVHLTPEYIDRCKRLNKFYRNPYRKMKATLKRDYCSTPLQTMGTTVGIIVLIVTTMLTILSFRQAIWT